MTCRCEQTHSLAVNCVFKIFKFSAERADVNQVKHFANTAGVFLVS